MRLLVLLLVVPFLELVALVAAARTFGTPQALLALVLLSVVGGWLVKSAGLGVLRRLRATVARGEVPRREMVDGVLLFVAGILLLVPGFVTGAAGLFILFPPTRAMIRAGLMSRFRLEGAVQVAETIHVRRRGVVDVQATEVEADLVEPVDPFGDDPSDEPPSLPR
jgi:UPF0716 protein FxsA